MQYTTSPMGSLTTAIELQPLADWLVLDVSDPVLPMVARMATAQAVEFMERELVNRARVVIYQEWPTIGTNSHPSISPSDLRPLHDVPLPYASLQTVDSVEVYGELTTDYTTVQGKPDAIRLQPEYGTEDDQPALAIEYTAGYGATVASVPEEIRNAIMMLAAFLYEHRGSCDGAEAMNRSGAGAALRPYRMRGVLL